MTQKYRADVDGLRALAVGLVVAYHAFPSWVKGGFIGVDVFFVISGFLISSIIFDQLATNSFSISDFYARRVRRIFPALILVLVVSMAAGWFVLLADEFRQLGLHAAAGIGFVANFVLWSESGYFDSAAEHKPLLHLWSLAIEEQFYLLWPLVAMWAWRHGRTGAWLIAVLAAASFASNVALIRGDSVEAFYAPYTRFWELICGAMLALTQRTWQQRVVGWSHRYGSAASVVGLSVILAFAFGVSASPSFPGWLAVIPVIGALLIIAAGERSFVNRRLLSIRIVVWIGLISYPLYLWHWPLLSFLRIVQGGLPPPELKLAAVALAVVLAWGTYRWIERPIRFGGPIWKTTKPLFAAGLGVAIIGAFLFRQDLRPRMDGKELQAIVAASLDSDFLGGFKKASVAGQQFLKIDTGSKSVTLFIGDSHVQHFGPRITYLLKDHGNNANAVYMAALGGCAPIPNVYAPHNEPGCSALRGAALNFALDARVSSVVIGGCWNCYFIHQAGRSDINGVGLGYEYRTATTSLPFNGGLGADAAEEELISLLTRLMRTGKKVYLVLDNPYDLRLDPKTYVSGTRLSSVYASNMVPQSVAVMPEEVALHLRLKQKAELAGVEVIDPRESVCDSLRCRVLDESGMFIYQDRNHFTTAYVKRQASFLDKTVLPLEQ